MRCSKLSFRSSLPMLIMLALAPSVGAAKEWWQGSFVKEYDTQTLIKEGHARPFNCRDAAAGPKTITAETINTRNIKCKIKEVIKIPNYEVVIIKSICEGWEDGVKYPPYIGEEMFLRLEPEGRILAYHKGRIGEYHLPYTDELSACEWRD